MARSVPARIILLAGLAAAPMPVAAAPPHYPETVKLDTKPTGK